MWSGLIVAGAAALNHFGWLFSTRSPRSPGVDHCWLDQGVRGRPCTASSRRHTRLAGWLRRQSGRQGPAPLLLLAAAIGLAVPPFAFDSIPAIFGITTNALLVVACNVFALMVLRASCTRCWPGCWAGSSHPEHRPSASSAPSSEGEAAAARAARLRGGLVADIPAWLSVLVVAGVLLATVGAGLIDGRRLHGLAGSGRTPPAPLRRGRHRRERKPSPGHDCLLLIQRLCQTFGHPADSAAGRAVATALDILFDTMLSHLDANRDGVISREEFVAGVGPGSRASLPSHAAVGATARSLIQVADADGNGLLDPGEYTRLAAVYGARADQAERAFGLLDQDRNGVLDATEPPWPSASSSPAGTRVATATSGPRATRDRRRPAALHDPFILAQHPLEHRRLTSRGQNMAHRSIRWRC